MVRVALGVSEIAGRLRASKPANQIGDASAQHKRPLRQSLGSMTRVDEAVFVGGYHV